jgi:Cu/Ag efflux pump CusA
LHTISAAVAKVRKSQEHPVLSAFCGTQDTKAVSADLKKIYRAATVVEAEFHRALMFLSNVWTALVVAVNIPLTPLFAFAVLCFRGKSANLLSIGAADFGIIVDSSVMIAENICRQPAAGVPERLAPHR